MSNIATNRFIIGWENLDSSPDYDYNDVFQTVMDHDGFNSLSLETSQEDFNGIKTYRIYALDSASIDIITEYGDNILTDRLFVYKNDYLVHYVDISPSNLYDLKNISVIAGDEITLRIKSPSGLDIYQWQLWSDSRSRANLLEIDDSYYVNGKRKIYNALIYQENHDILPFSLKIESSFLNNGDLPFSLNTLNDFNLKQWVKKSTAKQEYSFQEHNNHFYVDILSKDKSGIKMKNVRFENKIYGYEKIEDVFYTPKFSWETTIDESDETTKDESEEEKNYNLFWAGNTNNLLIQFQYNEEDLKKQTEIILDSEPYSILRSNKYFYLTGYENLNIFNRGESLEKEISILNNNNDVFSLEHDGSIWTTQSYNGKITKRDINTLSVLEEYEGFDAPKKIIYSLFHKCLFISGTNILWKLENGEKKAVYEINNYRIKDFDISNEGKICLIFHGENDQYIRVLNPDLYSFSLNERILNASASFCKYCKDIFYILIEKNNNELTYNISNYIFNTKTNNLQIINQEIEKIVVTTTTTKTQVDSKISIIYPNIDAEILKGQNIEVLWDSTESITDLVSISLLKGDSTLKVLETSFSNIGVYSWDIPKDLEDGIDYRLEIKWLGASDIDANKDISEDFSILTESTNQPTPILSNALGIDYNPYDNKIGIMLKNGLFGYFNLNDMLFYGLFDTGFSSMNCFSLSNIYKKSKLDIQKIRVFVGTHPNLNNKWDSGYIETDKNYIYYGGGKNLINGETYYWNIQFYEADKGWSDVHTQEFTMPKKGV